MSLLLNSDAVNDFLPLSVYENLFIFSSCSIVFLAAVITFDMQIKLRSSDFIKYITVYEAKAEF